MGPFIHVSSAKFPVLPGESDELVNEGTYGKALAEYLVIRLRECGYNVPFCCCEDWGWWVELAGLPFTFGVCIYGQQLDDGRLDLYVTDGAIQERHWSWRGLQFVTTTADVTRLYKDLIDIFSADPDIQVHATDLQSPFAENKVD